MNIGAGTITANYDGERKHRTRHRRRRLHRLRHDPARAGDGRRGRRHRRRLAWSPGTCPPASWPSACRRASASADAATGRTEPAARRQLAADGQLAPELLIIAVLILLNGVFVAAEIALVTVRRSRIQQLSRRGRPRAPGGSAGWSSSPAASWPSIQIGITFVGFLAAAFAGASIAGDLADVLRDDPGLAALGGRPGPAHRHALVSLVTIVFGELVPKTLALAHAERYALSLARPVELLGRVLAPVVWLLTTVTARRHPPARRPRHRPTSASAPRS